MIALFAVLAFVAAVAGLLVGRVRVRRLAQLIACYRPSARVRPVAPYIPAQRVPGAAMDDGPAYDRAAREMNAGADGRRVTGVAGVVGGVAGSSEGTGDGNRDSESDSGSDTLDRDPVPERQIGHQSGSRSNR